MDFIDKIYEEIVNPFIWLMLAVAGVYFVWGVFLFVKDYDDEGERSNGKRHLVYGIIGLAVILSVKGIIALITDTVSL
ncbi:MAG: hypothetical protein KAR24_00450 [Candidatus Pacebacteria bacterium]|nr:hypothetical protein [Candidatus Paceibacterota bacterium]MCK5591151.1 hypothetical protein [Candidatus Paceibacterota bacterium]